MKYLCVNGHSFTHPEEHTENEFNGLVTRTDTFIHPADNVVVAYTITKRCPTCQSITYTETPSVEPVVEAVYVYDLTSGDQKLLATLLAEGWTITSRYAKQYILEKLKEEKKNGL